MRFISAGAGTWAELRNMIENKDTIKRSQFLGFFDEFFQLKFAMTLKTNEFLQDDCVLKFDNINISS